MLRKKLKDFRRHVVWQLLLGVEQNHQFLKLHHLRREIGKYLVAETTISIDEKNIVSFHAAGRIVAKMGRYISSGRTYVQVELADELLELTAHFQGAFPGSYVFFRQLPLELKRDA